MGQSSRKGRGTAQLSQSSGIHTPRGLDTPAYRASPGQAPPSPTPHPLTPPNTVATDVPLLSWALHTPDPTAARGLVLSHLTDVVTEAQTQGQCQE